MAERTIEVTVEDMIAEVRREIRMREQVYGKVQPMPAVNVRRIEVMTAVLKVLEALPLKQGKMF
jgi:hypothetical protein